MKLIDGKMVLTVEDVLHRFVLVDGVPGVDKIQRTREGHVKAVRDNMLVIAIWEGVARDDTIIEVGFDEKRWHLRYPGKGESR